MNYNQVIIRTFSVFYVLFIGISSALFFCLSSLIYLVTIFFDRRRIALNLFASFWASVYIWCMPLWAVRIIDRHKLDMKKSYVMVSNHQSQLDIIVLYRLFFPFRWVSKAEVFRLPFIGWNMVLNGYVKLRRGDRESIAGMMQACEDLLRKGNSVFFFPEGTRSATGRLKPFKPGAFILAKKLQKPILPVVLNHTRDALPKHTLRLTGRHEMTVRVLDEIPFSQFSHMAPEDIGDMVRTLIAGHVAAHDGDKALHSQLN